MDWCDGVCEKCEYKETCIFVEGKDLEDFEQII